MKPGDLVTAVIRNNAANAPDGVPVYGVVMAIAGDDPAAPTQIQVETQIGICVWLPAADVTPQT